MSKALVYKATGDDSKEPAGYVLKELAQCTFASISDTQTILDYLLKRLEKEAADVKFKSLRTMKYLCINGRPEFRLELQRSHDRIRSATSYRGPSDSLRGDSPSQRVRDEAKELLQALFNAIAVKSASTAGRIEGYSGGGSSSEPANEWSANVAAAAAARPPPREEATGKMVGYGNNEYVGKRDNEYIERLKARGTTNVPNVGNAPFRTYGNPTAYAAPMGDGGSRQPGQPGGVWASGSVDTTLQSRSGGFSSSTSTHAPTPIRPKSNGDYESKLIDAITAATGVRPAPTADELNKFMVAFESLDKPIVASLLVTKLAPSTPFISQMKALAVLEALLQQQHSEDVEDFICENSNYLEDIEKSANAQLKAKANKILELVGLKEQQQASHPANSAAASYAATATSAAHSTDLLNIGDLSASGSTTNGATKAADSSFDFLNSQNHGHGGNDVHNLFGNLQIKDPQTAPAAAPIANSHANPLGDIFGSSAAPKPTVSAPSSSDPLAAFLDTSSAAPAPTSSSNSALNGDFLNSMTSSAKVDPLTALMNSKSPGIQPPRANVPFHAAPSMYPPQAAYPAHAYPGAMYPPHPAAVYAPAPYGYPPNGPAGMYAPAPVGYPMHPSAYPPNPAAFPAPAPFASPLQPFSKPVASSPMDFHVQAAKTASPLPTAANSAPPQPSNSSFGFIGGGTASVKGDSFGFVNDLMKS